MNGNPARSRFHPYRTKALFPIIAGLAVLSMAILIAWALTGAEKQSFSLIRAVAATSLVLINPIGLVGIWCIGTGIGIWQAHVVMSDEGLDIFAHRFSMWSLRRMRRGKLAWNEVVGIQPFALTNMLAPDGVQKEIIVYTKVGEFVLPDLMWPDVQEIAAQISSHIGKAIGDLSAVPAPITGKSPEDLRGVRLMHGFGWFVQMLGWLFAALSLVAALGGADFRTMMSMLIMSMFVVLCGYSLRRFRMG